MLKITSHVYPLMKLVISAKASFLRGQCGSISYTSLDIVSIIFPGETVYLANNPLPKTPDANCLIMFVNWVNSLDKSL